jgi:hypothetical protein
MPYVIGQNGLALIRGKNTLAELVSRFGPAARWRAIGLIVTFRRGVLVRASVTGHRWTTLTGARVGDPLAELIWRIGGRRVAGGWLVATGAQYHSMLVARIRNGRVTGFVATLG